MVTDADSHAEEDRKRKEEVEVRNTADTPRLRDREDPEGPRRQGARGHEEPTNEAAIEAAKKALEGSDVDEIKSDDREAPGRPATSSPRSSTQAAAGGRAPRARREPPLPTPARTSSTPTTRSSTETSSDERPRRTTSGGGASRLRLLREHSNRARADERRRRVTTRSIPSSIADLGAEFELRGDVVEARAGGGAAPRRPSWRDQALRAQAEFENFRKRIARERGMTTRYSVPASASSRSCCRSSTTSSARSSTRRRTTRSSDLADGRRRRCTRKLLGVLGKEGVEVIDPFGRAVRPDDAAGRAASRRTPRCPTTPSSRSFQKGYEMRGRVLRPAMVVVSTGGPAARGVAPWRPPPTTTTSSA